MLESSTRFSWLVLIFGGILSVGCVDPEGEYDEFKERDKKTTLPQGTGCGDPTAACESPTAGGLTSQWLFGLATQLGPTKPLLFFAETTATSTASGIDWAWTSLRPLDAASKQPLEPLAVTLPPSTVPPDGMWSVSLPTIAVPGAANPISGSDVEAHVDLAGEVGEAGILPSVCGGRDFLCGSMTGEVTSLGGQPTSVPLTGSWTLARLPAQDQLPEKIFVNCSCVEAQ